VREEVGSCAGVRGAFLRLQTPVSGSFRLPNVGPVEKGDCMRRLISVIVVTVAMTAVLATPAGAAPANPSCWGVVTSQRATTLHDIGTHSSAQAEPRMGLGNFARFLFDMGLTAGTHISDTATVAAALDGIPETSCP